MDDINERKVQSMSKKLEKHNELGELKFNKKLAPKLVKEINEFVSKKHLNNKKSGKKYQDEFCYFYITKSGTLAINRNAWYAEGIVGWLKYLIKEYFEPNNYKLSGTLKDFTSGEMKTIEVKNNKICVKQYYDKCNEEILNWIGSKDIRAYLKKLKWNFSIIEAVAILNVSYGFNNVKSNMITIKKKHELFKKICKRFPDEKIEFHDKTYLSSEIINKYIKYVNDFIKDFEKNEKNMYFEWELILSNGKHFEWVEPFDTLNKCLSNAKKHIKDCVSEYEYKVEKIVVRKIYNQKNAPLLTDTVAIFNREFEYIDIFYGEIIKDKNEFWFLEKAPFLPLPFKDGDVVCYNNRKSVLMINCYDDIGYNNMLYTGFEGLFYNSPDFPDETDEWLNRLEYGKVSKKDMPKIAKMKKEAKKVMEKRYKDANI